MSNSFPDFPEFFYALWGYEPFPWQTMLAVRVTNGSWPQVLDLPTAAGKTACIDVAVYALARQADLQITERTAPRRIWFAVDRRIVVDAAYSRAKRISEKLKATEEGPLKKVADRLKKIGSTDQPLASARLRGGILRDDGWARLPSQPAVITSTIDQLGSRLLFRGYGRSDLTASIFAGLAAHDSLILLDEAHCSIPFLQTLKSIENYRGDKWAESPIQTPFAFAALSATSREENSEVAVFPGEERESALAHPELQKRLGAKKFAELVDPPLKAPRGQDADPLVMAAVEHAENSRKEGKTRIAVIVNRVNTAEKIAMELREKTKEAADVVLLTGRIRPYERDRSVDEWEKYLKAFEPETLKKPICLVSTQCIEVGADFSFDMLITECASLDALRQRFGRLDRMGALGESKSIILIREQDVKDGGDPIYGEALIKTWGLLNKKAAVTGEGKARKKILDFGFEALNATLSDVEDISPYLAPQTEAPVLFPAYLDLLCQTSPTPHPEPDVQLFLHGKKRGAPEVRVVWRADLSKEKDDKDWLEIVSLCPPNSGEMLSVPLYRLRRWLADQASIGDDADLEGVASKEDEQLESIAPCLLWRGRTSKQSLVCRKPSAIRPNDVVVLPADYGIAGLGQSVVSETMGRQALDLWEPSLISAGKPSALRINRVILEPWLETNPPLKDLLGLVESPEWENEDIKASIDAVLEYKSEDSESSILIPEWLKNIFRSIRNGRFEGYPGGGIIARGKKPDQIAEEPELFADEDDLTSTVLPVDRHEPVSLEEHSASVKWAVEKFASRCLPKEFIEHMKAAAYWHDVGKLDERFQTLLRHGNEFDVGDPLAKSVDIPMSPARRRFIYESSGLPENFRHEMLSTQLAGRFCQMEENQETTDIVLHLIASHHGYARPFPPVCIDETPPPVSGKLGGTLVELLEAERSQFIPHRLDSGIPERFWRLTRRYGWWGLAYLEAILRLADWYGSVRILKSAQDEEVTS